MEVTDPSHSQHDVPDAVTVLDDGSHVVFLTRQEWKAIHDDYKLLRADGSRAVLVRYATIGACLVPAEIVDARRRCP